MIDGKLVIGVIAEHVIDMEVLVLYAFTHLNLNYNKKCITDLSIFISRMRKLIFSTQSQTSSWTN